MEIVSSNLKEKITRNIVEIDIYGILNQSVLHESNERLLK